MSGHRVPSGFGEAEYTEKRSRFIGHVWHVESEQQALEHITQTREKYWDATHNVYAYILREGNIMRYTDDGEPSGTSGVPVLNVFRSGGITDVCCVVTRYFGGIKLGTGGLARAYPAAAKLALEAAGVSLLQIWADLRIVCSYAQYERVSKQITLSGGMALGADFGGEVILTAAVPEEETEKLIAAVIDLTAGAVAPEVTGSSFRAVPER